MKGREESQRAGQTMLEGKWIRRLYQGRCDGQNSSGEIHTSMRLIFLTTSSFSVIAVLKSMHNNSKGEWYEQQRMKLSSNDL